MVLPLVLSIAGGLLPSIISAIAGSKTQAQARVAVQPEYDAMVSQLIGRGMKRAEAEAEADNAIQGEVASKMQEGALPGWAEGLLGVAGGIGGWAAGAKLAARGAAKALGKDATKEVAESAAPAAPAAPAATSTRPPPVPDAHKRDVPSRAKMAENDVNAEAARAGRFDRVNPTAESGGAVVEVPPPLYRPGPRDVEFEVVDDLIEPFRLGRSQPRRLGYSPEQP